MKQHLIFLVALLTTLSMVNAIPYYQLDKRATTFGPCFTGSPFPITVSLQPDPPVPGQNCIFTVTGTVDSGINPGAKMVVQGLDTTGNQIGDPIVNDICTVPGITCPVTSFSIVETVAISASLSGTYSIVVSILSETGAVLGCSMGTVTG
ncbi:hypothetical protein RhiirA5_367364 [Rhizophagus irregularis]|uniref:Phosphatidylglycerol/phosphatidylinositol transfer protein n=3 Tax=Rhizophagus irregularis TaxID=588596 RepID=A0A2N0RC88_9GLOM|nr:hypothetical protein GLOIN_2v1573201 [Rhizophagus irregularis DAOM 181602=DAOM 197198]EXX53772.1 hypothetical protein RirG_240860 [Rhizophagus irregularis DAOM 197198w]PKB97593.1 hypothetical protein RhiirA5_367364 [Rhizophagus irregularis]PKC60922.1 hypothetical protein RhiirA1_425395 [Rhizophagus irregularis]POG74629.1 hypothetical protein GLOIN_2v1573201 [Rhizophagus irregularis DAOM 181602=DAOM 197198]UZO10091.1 hypothetical protein OCT59_001689 [Rhizophagus irregularis]|eukprot:XP_025181495.1 hypothetical protein GLOIN_2v1573201 [Rhizophagus irregularis DAOM 181602=DAOM 197198]